MRLFKGKIGSWRRAKADRRRREAQAQRARTYVARDGRGRVISAH